MKIYCLVFSKNNGRTPLKLTSERTIKSTTASHSHIDNTSSKKVVAVINPSTEVINYELTGEWYLIANENKVDLSKNNKVTGNVTIDSIGISIYANY
jgi:hypothetical protein